MVHSAYSYEEKRVTLTDLYVERASRLPGVVVWNRVLPGCAKAVRRRAIRLPLWEGRG